MTRLREHTCAALLTIGMLAGSLFERLWPPTAIPWHANPFDYEDDNL